MVNKMVNLLNKIISYAFYDHLFETSIILLCILFVGSFVFLIASKPSPIERTIPLAEGKLINIRAIGAWSISNVELKFEDGSMLLVTYRFSRDNQLKEDRYYKIWWSSKHGYQCELIENGN